jgi:aromatic ring-opening dioxygenase catalytic subunit (LigB family)
MPAVFLGHGSPMNALDHNRYTQAWSDFGVLVVGSGNAVHNLGLVNWSRPDDGYDWTQRFDDAAAES